MAYVTLLRLCNQDEENLDDLPTVWRDLSRAKKGEERRILEMALQDRAQVCFGEGSAASVFVPADLATKVKQLALIAPDPSDLDLGINVFSLPFMSAAQMTEATIVAAQYDHLHGGAQVTLDDLRQLGGAGKVVLPLSLHQAMHVGSLE